MGKENIHEREQFLFYSSPDGDVKIEVFFQNETVWLTQKKIAELFNVDRSVITKHLNNILKEKELAENSVSANFAHTAEDGKTYQTKFYNLDAIIAVGYRVNSKKATQFRIWATRTLHEYIIKGFVLDDERLKQKGGRYFDELIERIREIRTSERNFYQKVTDLFATSIDYDANSLITKDFFATVQNKMHYAVTRKTAAEIIAERADSKKENMGLTSFKGDLIIRSDAHIAKNYLSLEEIKQLNLLVETYLSFAELQALNKKPMTMNEWLKRLDDYLKFSEKEVLKNAGKISAKIADEIADREFDKYKTEKMINFESDFDKIMKKYLSKKSIKK